MTDNNIPILDPRLSLAASFVREGSTVADIGTDHAYLPIYLLQKKISKNAVAADINKGPLERARINCEKYCISHNMTFCLSDGLKDIPLEELGVTDIVICGMGGELIASILDASDYVKTPSVRLILQPMSQIARLRSYLCDSGFKTVGGAVIEAQDRLYQCIVCEYDGISRTVSSAALELGEENISNPRQRAFPKMLLQLIGKTQRAIEGRTKGGLDSTELSSLLSELYRIKNDIGL